MPILTISNIEPFSNVGVFVDREMNTALPRIFVGRIFKDSLQVDLDPKLVGSMLIVRVRNAGYLPFETHIPVTSDDWECFAIQQVDNIYGSNVTADDIASAKIRAAMYGWFTERYGECEIGDRGSRFFKETVGIVCRRWVIEAVTRKTSIAVRWEDPEMFDKIKELLDGECKKGSDGKVAAMVEAS